MAQREGKCMAFWNQHRTKNTKIYIPPELTAESPEVSQCNEMIQQEVKINDAYVQIGQLYVTMHSDSPDEAMVPLIQQIETSTRKISELQQQIKTIKGVQKCPHCGAEVPLSASFCIFCGTAMPKASVISDTDTIACPNCGAVIKKGAKFCSSCGKPISLPSSEHSAETPAAPMRFCPNCGALADGDAAFCTICGAKI